MTREQLITYLKGNVLNDIVLYQVNPGHIGDDKMLIIDGGIEFTIENKILSFAWDFENEMFLVNPGPAGDLLQGIAFFTIEESNPCLTSLKNKLITDADVRMTTYHELDEDLKPGEEAQETPLSIVLKFEDGSILQIAAIAFDIEDDSIKHLRFNLANQLLVSFNRELPIAEPT